MDPAFEPPLALAHDLLLLGETRKETQMASRNKSTIAKISGAVKEAAQTVIQKADEYVVEPVGAALGLRGKPKSRKRPARSRDGVTVRKTKPAKKRMVAARRRKALSRIK
jgi:hypothetical protein